MNNKRIDQVIKRDDCQGKQNDETAQPVRHVNGIAGDETFEKTCSNGKRNGAQEYFETVFEPNFKGIHSRIGFGKQDGSTQDVTCGSFDHDAENFHRSVNPDAANAFPKNTLLKEKILERTQHDGILQRNKKSANASKNSKYVTHHPDFQIIERDAYETPPIASRFVDCNRISRLDVFQSCIDVAVAKD